MLLLSPSHQLHKRWHDYINDCVLLLEFLKYGDMSQIERMNICEKGVITLEKDMAKCWHLHHLTSKTNMQKRPSSLPTLLLFSIQQQLTIVFKRGAQPIQMKPLPTTTDNCIPGGAQSIPRKPLPQIQKWQSHPKFCKQTRLHEISNHNAEKSDNESHDKKLIPKLDRAMPKQNACGQRVQRVVFLKKQI